MDSISISSARSRKRSDRNSRISKWRTDPMTETQPSRRERRRLEIRDRIVETAFMLFETDGYEATTVTEIAARADIAYGTLFQHFPSKLDLLREVSG
ncbi:MAG TPA: TetR/AcrR family transcriptional regulator, partial [Myxococcales bacterium]|nr:TetR/AcrR family transcriptional regulator [Myxococcales bacterium]